MSKLERIKEREQKQLAVLRKKAARPSYAAYPIVIFVVAILIHIVDEIASLIGNNIKSSMVEEFFVRGQGVTFNEGLSTLAALGIVSLPIMLLAAFYKPLSDKYGRKPFLVINTMGMAVGMLISMFAKTFPVYFAGTLISTFFIAHDMQVIYILEIAPPDKRARWYGISKAIGTLGFVLVPLMRQAFMGDDPTRWRLVYLVPIIMTIVFSLLALILAKESGVFLKDRISILEKPYEQRIEESRLAKDQKKADRNKSGIIAALKYILKNRQLRWIVIVVALYYVTGMGLTSYYEPIMYAAQMSTENITKALFMYGFMFAAILFIAGFIADRFGRKATVVLFGTLSLALFGMFVFAAYKGWNPYLVGAFYGLYIGSFWQGGDYLSIMLTESTPTSMRTSAMSAMFIPLLFAGILSMIYMTIALRLTSIHNAILYIAVPGILLAMVLCLFKIKETKGADLTTIGREDEITSI